MLCHFDQCHEVEPSKHAHNKRYCGPCKCHRKVEAARRRMPTTEVTCVYDSCHTFKASAPGAKYCPRCNCYIVAKQKRDREAARQTLEQAEELFEQPQEFAVLRIPRLKDGTTVIIINDLQIPFQDKRTLECVEKFWDDFNPDIEIYNGDIFDFYSISQFDTNPSRAFSLQDELDQARVFLERRANKNPNGRRIFGDGNHEDRLRRWLWRHGPELHSLRALQLEELLGLTELGFEHINYRSVIDLLGFRIEHGYRASKSAAFPINVARLMAIATGSSGLCGHTHRFSHYGWADSRGSHSYIENGCLCLLQLEYAPFPNWQQSFCTGIVFNNRLHLSPIRVYDDGFVVNGERYPRK